MKLTSMTALPKASSLLSLILCTSFLAVAPVSVSASEVGASERVNFSGTLRMLSQRVTATVCNYDAGVADQDSLAVLKGDQSEVVKIANGLAFGDADAVGALKGTMQMFEVTLSALRGGTTSAGINPAPKTETF